MIGKKNRTIETYLRAGAEIRLYKEVYHHMMQAIGPALYTKDIDKLIRIENQIGIIAIRAEDNMFRDYPELSNDYLCVFHGDIHSRPRNEVDKIVMEMAQVIARNMCDGKKEVE